jgi:DNA-binding MarR family transcriptional regulator
VRASERAARRSAASARGTGPDPPVASQPGIRGGPLLTAGRFTSLSSTVAAPLSFDPIAEARRQWDEHWGSDATASMAAVTSIMRAQQIVMARLNQLLDPLDLTFPRYEALMLLLYSRKGQLPLGKISDRLQVHRASVTNVVDKLVGSGYVERVQHGQDRRAVLALITADGRRAARQATKRLNAAWFGMEPLDSAACEGLYSALTPLRAGAGDYELPG